MFFGRRITVMGLGRFGGGVAVTNFLVDRGAQVTLTDLRGEEELADSLAMIDRDRLANLHLGSHRREDFEHAEILVVNPAVSPSSEFVAIAVENGASITSEIQLFWQHNPAPVIGVTGTNGKSTTAAMIASILGTHLEETGRNCWLGGNIGRSLLPVVERIQADDWVVLELSSFQLADLDGMFTSPEISVVTNFAPHHLNWHGTVDDYIHAKQAILRWQTPEQICVLNEKDREVARWKTQGHRVGFGRPTEGDCLFRRGKKITARIGGRETTLPINLKLRGKHNLDNALAAAAAAMSAGVRLETIVSSLESFRGLPHRLEPVGEWQGRTFVNDSVATTSDSVAAGLASFRKPIVLLLGGSDNGADLSPFSACFKPPVEAVALMGETALRLGLLSAETEVARSECRTFEEAFAWALEQSRPGDVVLLSPGFPSYDWFPHYAARGRRFRELVSDLRGESDFVSE